MGLQKYVSKFLAQKRKAKLSEKDYILITELSKILGYNIRNISLYHEAFSLKDSLKRSDKSNYERLEFLGDSVLGAIISCQLFHTYPQANEGYLTQMKSKIVNRKNLNKHGEELNLTKYIISNGTPMLGENISGNLFEAFIGAIYLDFGYDLCKKIVLNRLLTPKVINNLENKIVSYKSLLLEWSQKKKINIRYETSEEVHPNRSIVFRCHVWVDNENITNACESSKKKAEEKAAQRTFYILNKKKHILENSKTIP